MASTYVTVSQVGSYFVEQYYKLLQQKPGDLHQFYNDLSTMVRVDGDSTVNASAVYQIHTLIQSLHFSAIEIKTINSIESWREGIVVVVSGSVRSKLFSGWRKFVQTFFLAPQESGYFVMNDIFHFVSEEANNHFPAPANNHFLAPANNHLPAPLTAGHRDDYQPVNSTPQEHLVPGDSLEAKLRENFNSLHLQDEYQGDYYTSEQQQYQPQEEEDGDGEEDYEEEPPVKEPSYNHVDYVQEPLHQNAVEYYQEPLHHDTLEYVQEPIQAVEEPAPEPVKFTYASILGKSVPSAPTQAPVVKSAPPTKELHRTPEPVASYVPETTSVVRESSVNEEGELLSVYVRNLPTSVTSQEIYQEFKNFGKIAQDGVFLKNRLDVGVCFAFVEFEDVSGVHKAIEASPIQLAGRQVYIEERRANSSGGSRGGNIYEGEEEGQEAEEVMAVFLMEGAMDPVTTKVNITMFSVVDYSFGFKADY
ncbi:putative G3BP-like protein [Tanacetum coccineum]